MIPGSCELVQSARLRAVQGGLRCQDVAILPEVGTKPGSHATIMPMMLPFSWQECRLCGGAYLLWSNPSAPQDSDDTGLGERWTDWMHLDGRPYAEEDSASCNTCGGLDFESMTASQRRWGLSLPHVTQEALRRQGLGAPPRSDGFVTSGPAPVLVGDGTSLRPIDEEPLPTVPAEILAQWQRPAVAKEPWSVSPVAAFLSRVFRESPRATVQTYADDEEITLRDPVILSIVVVCLIALVSVIVSNWMSPGSVPS